MEPASEKNASSLADDELVVRHITSLSDLRDGRYWLGLRETETSPAVFLWEIEILDGVYMPNRLQSGRLTFNRGPIAWIIKSLQWTGDGPYLLFRTTKGQDMPRSAMRRMLKYLVN